MNRTCIKTGPTAITRIGQDQGQLFFINYPGNYYCLFVTVLDTGTADHVIIYETSGTYICMNIPWREQGLIPERFLVADFSAGAAEIAWSTREVNLGIAVFVEDQNGVLTGWNTFPAAIAQWLEFFTIAGPGRPDRKLLRCGWLFRCQQLYTGLSSIFFSITLKEIFKTLISKKRSKVHARFHHDN